MPQDISQAVEWYVVAEMVVGAFGLIASLLMLGAFWALKPRECSCGRHMRFSPHRNTWEQWVWHRCDWCETMREA